VASQNKALNLPNLSVELGPFTYQCAADTTKQVTTRTFNGVLPGPSMVLDPGDRITLTLTNNLPPNQEGTSAGQCSSTDPHALLNYPSCFNTFNMHFHGLHVSPTSYCNPPGSTGDESLKVLSSDDVLYELPPGTSDNPSPSHNWCIWLPDFHAPGTHWYHAHRHGSTGLQVSNGMAGAIIVREPLQYQIVPPTQEKIWIIQEIILPTQTNATQQQQDLAVYQVGGTGGAIAAKSSGDFLVNGRFQPTVTLKAGQIERWRFINANSTPRGFMNLQLYKISSDPNTPPSNPNANPTAGSLAPLWLIAVDGISFYGKPPTLIGCNTNAQPEPGLPTTGCNGWDIAAGNRADFLVQLDPGWYTVVKNLPSKGGGGTAPQILAYVKVELPSFPKRFTKQNIPALVPGIALSSSDNPYKRYLRPITDAEVTGSGGGITQRNIIFSTQPPAGPQKYFINKGTNGSSGLYSPSCSDVTVNLGTCEQWNLSTTGGAAHPFHIHVNPFQIVGDKIDPNGPNDPSNWRFWDTIAVPSNSNTTIRSRFADYTGTYVFHCHILIHEDQGMMKNVTVQDTETVNWPTMPASGTLPDGVGAPPCTSLSNNSQYAISPEAQTILAGGGNVCTPLPACNPATVSTSSVPPNPNPPVISCTGATCS
jgi:FtsP/CotA-like multicopper oxidase with cupredoxin domain